jgi:hypothetical protein
MLTISKIPLLSEHTTLNLPQNAQLTAVLLQNGRLSLVVKYDPNAPTVPRRFLAVECDGEPVTNCRYVGRACEGEYCVCVYEVLEG